MESSTLEYLTTQNCNLTKVGSNLDSRGYGVATRRNWDFNQGRHPILDCFTYFKIDLSVVILKLVENGQLDNLRRKWWVSDGKQ